ncbi:MAG: C69 family dipeptidase [Spirochaetaceae bacterium]|nr:C69 family dipeptidase [Myxococcales bacterium]MCB9723274.1 C69 family dipeptidase [Spirochaetaceae bacterium]HPG24405.1 C69 family dipeptidase [Myxococcota bacterium]
MCDSLVARGSRTADGATLFAKNSDRRGRESQPFVQLPEAFHPRGSTVRCTHVEIDQVGETYRVMGHSPDWCWGFEQGVNEYGVAIGNHATWSREPVEPTPGLIGMDLVRLGLERGRDAREALEVIATLVETHGQGGSSFGPEGDDGYQNSFVIADGRSAWVLETTARSWAARSVEGAALTNALTLGADWQIGSRDLERRALQQGFWARDERLDFRAAYALPQWPLFLTERRAASASRLLAGPPLTVASLEAWLRDHGAGDTPPDARLEPSDPARYSVCMHVAPTSETTASLVVRLPSQTGHRPWPVWISFAAPCSGLFVPVYLEGVIPAEMARAEGADSVWQVFRALQEAAAGDPAHALPWLRERWRPIERAIGLERVRAEQTAADCLAREDDDGAGRCLSTFMRDTTGRVLETARELGRALGASATRDAGCAGR